MYKYFNPEHEAIIHTTINAVGSTETLSDGDLHPHKEIVDNVKFYLPNYNDLGYVMNHQEIKLTRKQILDLAKQIQDIESK